MIDRCQALCVYVGGRGYVIDDVPATSTDYEIRDACGLSLLTTLSHPPPPPPPPPPSLFPSLPPSPSLSPPLSLRSIDFLRGLAGDVYKNTTTSLAKEQAKAAAAAKPARDAAKQKAK